MEQNMASDIMITFVVCIQLSYNKYWYMCHWLY